MLEFLIVGLRVALDPRCWSFRIHGGGGFLSTVVEFIDRVQLSVSVVISATTDLFGCLGGVKRWRENALGLA